MPAEADRGSVSSLSLAGLSHPDPAGQAFQALSDWEYAKLHQSGMFHPVYNRAELWPEHPISGVSERLFRVDLRWPHRGAVCASRWTYSVVRRPLGIGKVYTLF